MKFNMFEYYTHLLYAEQHDKLSDFIDSLTHQQRIELRAECEQNSVLLMRNLYYDYVQQKWIESGEFHG